MSEKYIHRIGLIMPDDQSQSIKNYEFQIAEAARSALDLLKKNNYDHLLCEWHDDFVEVYANSDDGIRYTFCQVKTRKQGSGVFSYKEMFGIAFSKTTKARGRTKLSTDGILYKQFKCYLRFKEESKKFKVLSNYSFDERVLSLIEYIVQDLTDDEIIDYNIKRIVEFYGKELDLDLSEHDFKKFIKMVEIVPESNVLDEFRYKLEAEVRSILEKINEAPFYTSEIVRIVDDFLKLVRGRSKEKISVLPANYEDLVARKGVRLVDLFEYIGISKDIFYQIQDASPDRQQALRASSRLTRIFAHEDDDFRDKALDCKTDWSNWLRDNSGDLLLKKLRSIKIEFKNALAKINDEKIDIAEAVVFLERQFSKMPFQFSSTDKVLNERIIIGGLVDIICEYGGDR